MNETTDASAIFAPLWRRKWLILAAGLLVAAGAYKLNRHHKPAIFSVGTELNLAPGSEGSGGGKHAKVNAIGLDDEITIIEATVVPPVLRRFRHEHNNGAARANVFVRGAGESSFLLIGAEARTARGAADAANATARAYIAKRQRNYESSVLTGIANLRRKIRSLETIPAKSKKATKGAGASGTATGAISTAAALQIASLSNKISEAENSVTTKVITQLTPARPVGAVRVVTSTVKKNVEFGFVLGILLASLAAYVLSRYNRRLFTLADIEAAF
jgi:capsular polysaccharide biosynthesis protein